DTSGVLVDGKLQTAPHLSDKLLNLPARFQHTLTLGIGIDKIAPTYLASRLAHLLNLNCQGFMGRVESVDLQSYVHRMGSPSKKRAHDGALSLLPRDYQPSSFSTAAGSWLA